VARLRLCGAGERDRVYDPAVHSDRPTDTERAAGEFEIGFVCLFCAQVIAEDAADFAEVSVAVEAGFASFTCHVGCMRERAHDPSIFPDLETPATYPDDYVPPEPELLRAWAELTEVIGQVQDAELDSPADVRALADAITSAAERHGIVIEPLPPDDDE
jgi:hypothetical protein